MLVTDPLDNLLLAASRIRQNRGIWLIAFLCALFGGTGHSFSPWGRNSLSEGLLIGMPPFSAAGNEISHLLGDGAAIKVGVLAAGIAFGIAILIAGTGARCSVIIGVAHPGIPPRALLDRVGHLYPRYFIVAAGYLALLSIVSIPVLLLDLRPAGPTARLLLSLMTALTWVAAILISLAAGIILELATRFVALLDLDLRETFQRTAALLRRYWREVLVTWLWSAILLLTGVLLMHSVKILLEIPAGLIYDPAVINPGVPYILGGLFAYSLIWMLCTAVLAAFVIASSALWTVTFPVLVPGAGPAESERQ